jgi:hypothetical protein
VKCASAKLKDAQFVDDKFIILLKIGCAISLKNINTSVFASEWGRMQVQQVIQLSYKHQKNFKHYTLIATFFELHNTRNNSQCSKEERHSKPNIHLF